MKGDKKMIGVLCVLGVIGVLMIAASLMLAIVSCGTSKAPSPTEDVESEAPAPGEITRIKLVEGLTLRDVDMVRPEGIEHILGMLDVDTYEAVDADDAEAVYVIDRADVIMECYSGSELYGTVWITNDCRVCVMIEGGGIYRTATPAVDTVLICAEFGRES